MTDHMNLAFKSLKNLKRNPIIFLPSLISGILVLLLTFFLFISLGVLSVTSGGAFSYILFSFFLVLFGLPMFFASVYAQAMQYGVMNDVSSRGSSSFDRMMSHGKSYFLKMLSYVLVKLSIIVISILAIFLIALLIASLSSQEAGLLAGGLLFIIWLLLFTAFSVMNIFNAPILVTRKIGGLKVIVETMSYANKHFNHVIKTVLVIVLLWLVTGSISFLLGIPYIIIDVMIEFGFQPGFASFLIYILSLVVSSLVSWVATILMSFYTFNSYLSENSLLMKNSSSSGEDGGKKRHAPTKKRKKPARS